MILRLVKMHFRAEETADFLIYFETIKAQIEKMPGVISLKLYQDEKDPNVLFTHSTWLNQSSVDNYRQSETFGKIWPNTKELFASEPMAWSLKLK